LPRSKKDTQKKTRPGSRRTQSAGKKKKSRATAVAKDEVSSRKEQKPAEPETLKPAGASFDPDGTEGDQDEGLRDKAMAEFFASDNERGYVSSMSLDLYRDQIDTRLRAEGVHEYLSFALSDELFAVNILHIKEIIKPPMITEVPRTEPVILGVLSLRGTIVPVVDLRRRLNLAVEPQTRKSRILIAEISYNLTGLLVDEVRQVIRLREDDIEQAPGVFDRAEAEHIAGVGRHEGEMYTLLDLESVVQIDKYIRVSVGGMLE